MMLNYILYLLSLFMSFVILPIYILFLIYTLVVSFNQLTYFWFFLLALRLFILLSVYMYLFYCTIIKYYWPERNQFDNYMLKSSKYFIKLRANDLKAQLEKIKEENRKNVNE